MNYPDLIIVDENDDEIGRMSLRQSFEQKQIIRTARVIIFNNKGEVLIQKRGPAVFSPNTWNDSASGHVELGSSYKETALKELKEEMGITGVDLKLVDYCLRIEGLGGWGSHRMFTQTFFGTTSNTVVTHNDEVSDHKWLPVQEVIDWYYDSPGDFVGSFFSVIKTLKRTGS